MGHLVYNFLHYKSVEKFKDHELTDYSFAFSVPSTQRSFIDRLDAQIVESNPICPAAFDYSFDNHTGYDRAVDLQQLLLYIIPIMIIPNLQHEKAQVALMGLLM